MIGIQAMLIATRKMTKVLPTTRSSVSEGLFLTLVQMSIVKMVDDELKIEVREDMRAAIITASIKPRAPVVILYFIHIYLYSFITFPLIVCPQTIWQSSQTIFGTLWHEVEDESDIGDVGAPGL